MPPAPNCAVCGVPLAGPAAVLLAWRGIKRSARNPDTCTACGAHLEEGSLVELTVVFADLSSFTEMTGRLGAEKTYAVVDEYLRAAAGALTAQGAMIDKYIGDAVMAFFNIPVKRPDHAAAAVAAARDVQELLPKLSEKLGTPLKASVGIATGYAKVGRLGSDDPKDFTAIGQAVNQAARLQALAKAGEILVSEGVYEKVAASFPDVPAESLSLKGFSEPCVGYRLGGAPSAPIAAAPWTRARPVTNYAAVVMALLGSGCLGQGLASALYVVLGAGYASSLLAFARTLDNSPLRLPLLAVAAAASLGILGSLLNQRRLRAACVVRNRCVEMTPGELRRVWLAAGLALLALVLVGGELQHHYGGFAHLLRLLVGAA